MAAFFQKPCEGINVLTIKQMTEYPMGKNDDAPDGLQMAVKLALDVKIGRRVDYRSVIARALDFRRGAY